MIPIQFNPLNDGSVGAKHPAAARLFLRGGTGLIVIQQDVVPVHLDGERAELTITKPGARLIRTVW